MYPEEPTDDINLAFLKDFAQRKGLMSSPDETIQKLQADRWLGTWDRKVKGIPSMEINSEERYANYY